MNRHRVELLEFVQLPRLGSGLQRGEGGQRNEFVVRSGDVDLLQLIGGQTVRAFDLRNDFVAPALDAEAIDVVAAEHGGKILAGLGQVDSLRAEFVAVEDDLSLRLVELQVGVGVNEEAAGERFLHELVGKLAELPRLGCRDNHELNREISATRQRRRRQRDHANARNLRQWPDGFDQQLLSCLFPLAPRLRHHASETAARRSDLKDAFALGERVINIVDLSREQIGLINRRVGGGLDDSEDNSLVLSRRQFVLREHVERHDQRDDNRPENKNHGPVLQRASEHARISATHALKAAIDHSREAALGVSGAQQLRAHHRRQGQRHHAGNDHGAGERERELAEQRTGQTALNTDRRVHRGERDGHRDDRADQFAGSIDGRPERCLAQVKMPLDVLHHHDCVIHHQADREHDRQQGQAG